MKSTTIDFDKKFIVLCLRPCMLDSRRSTLLIRSRTGNLFCKACSIQHTAFLAFIHLHNVSGCYDKGHDLKMLHYVIRGIYLFLNTMSLGGFSTKGD